MNKHNVRPKDIALSIGDFAHEYFRFLLDTKESYWFRSVRAILGLAKEHGDEAVNLTLKRALYYQVRDLTTIKNIITKKLYLVPEEPRLLNKQHQTDTPMEQHVGEQTGLFRDLSYYTQTQRSVV